MKSIIVSAIITLSICNPGWADGNLTIGEMLRKYDNGSADHKGFYEKYIGRQGEGMGIANYALNQKGRSSLYCVPNNLALSHNQYFSLFRGIVEEMKYPLTRPAGTSGVYLIIALMENFPCKK